MRPAFLVTLDKSETKARVAQRRMPSARALHVDSSLVELASKFNGGLF
jgi:hypothetical protein